LGREVAIPVTALALLAHSVTLNRLQSSGLIGDLKLVAVHFPLDSNEKIEVHSFRFQPRFQVLAGIGAEFDEHFSFEHIHEHAFSVSEPTGLHALRKSFSSLACEASECVLREVAWH